MFSSNHQSLVDLWAFLNSINKFFTKSHASGLCRAYAINFSSETVFPESLDNFLSMKSATTFPFVMRSCFNKSLILFGEIVPAECVLSFDNNFANLWSESFLNMDWRTKYSGTFASASTAAACILLLSASFYLLLNKHPFPSADF